MRVQVHGLSCGLSRDWTMLGACGKDIILNTDGEPVFAVSQKILNTAGTHRKSQHHWASCPTIHFKCCLKGNSGMTSRVLFEDEIQSNLDPEQRLCVLLVMFVAHAYRGPCQTSILCVNRKLRIFTHLLDWKRCSKALSRHHSYHSHHPCFLASDCVLRPCRCLVKRSAVLFFVSSLPTDRRFSCIHFFIAKHPISICLSRPGLLRCRMCRAESESISRRAETL